MRIMFLVIATVISLVWLTSGCSKAQGGGDAKDKRETSTSMAPPSTSTSGDNPLIQLSFVSGTYRLIGDTAAKVTVRLIASSSENSVKAYFNLPYACKVQSPKAAPMIINAGGPSKNSPEMQVFDVTNQPQDVSVTLSYQFNLDPEDVKELRPLVFQIRYSYQGVTSNWVDCQATRVSVPKATD